MDWIESLVLGAIQGLTEFLPISSDGHLNLAQKLFALATGKSRSEEEVLFFFVMLHVGTTIAILVQYRKQILAGIRGFLGSTEVADDYRRPSIIRVGALAVVGTLPLVVDVVVKKKIEATFGDIKFTAAGFLSTAAMLIVTTRLRGGEKGPGRMTFLDALLIGLAQMFAPLPGVSRSGLTIVTALAVGLSRTWAVGFSLMLGVIAIGGATVLELKDIDAKFLTADRVSQTIAATIIAGLIGFAAIVWLVRIVRSGRLWYFSVYLILLAILIFSTMSRLGDGVHDRKKAALDRPLGIDAPGSGDPGRIAGTLARSFGPGEESGLSRSRAGRWERDRFARLDLDRSLAGTWPGQS